MILHIHPQTRLRIFHSKHDAIEWRRSDPNPKGGWRCHLGALQRVHVVYPSGHVVRERSRRW